MNLSKITKAAQACVEACTIEPAPGGPVNSADRTPSSPLRNDVAREASIRRDTESPLLQLQAALNECNEAIARSHDEDELFRTICRALVKFGGLAMAWIGLVEEYSQRVKPVASYGDILAYLDGLETSINCDSPVSTAIREKKPVWIQDFQSAPLTAPQRNISPDADWGAMATLPLYRNGTVIGALSLYSKTKDVFGTEARKQLIEIVSDMCFALDNFAHEAEHKLVSKKLIASELRYRRLFESTKDGILVLDAETGEVVDVNPYLIKMLSFSHKEFFGKKIWDLGFFKEILASQQDFMGLQRKKYCRYEDLQLVAMDGRKFHVEFIINAYLVDGDKVVQCNIRDITERQQVKIQLLESKERYKRITEGLTDYQYTVRIENGRAVDSRHSPGCVMVTGYKPEEFASDPFLWIQIVAPEDRDKIRKHVQQILAGEDIAPVEYRIIRKDRNIRWVSDTTIMFKDTSGDLLSYDGVIKDITERKVADEQIKRYIAQLEDAFMRTVNVATTLNEMRDPYTVGHERRVANVAAAIGRALGLDESRIEGLRVAGQLHDIGKIGIPAEILAKPGRITSSEYLLIKDHPQFGFDALKDVGFPWPVADVALQHHERIDGSGYPHGLKGDAILLESRILAVADVVEAMASHRPYRPGQGIDKALAEIERGSGTVYDAEISENCLLLFREQGYTLPER